MLPYKLTFDHTQDITGTKEWIDSLIISENIPSLLTHYEPLTYSYHRVDKDLDGRPNHHIFTFSPKDKSQITPQRFEYIEKELDRKTLITDPLEEDQDWTLLNNGCIIICIRSTD
jgi:hypothetical protein